MTNQLQKYHREQIAKVDFSPIKDVLMELEMWMPRMMDSEKRYTWFEERAFKQFLTHYHNGLIKEVLKKIGNNEICLSCGKDKKPDLSNWCSEVWGKK